MVIYIFIMKTISSLYKNNYIIRLIITLLILNFKITRRTKHFYFVFITLCKKKDEPLKFNAR